MGLTPFDVQNLNNAIAGIGQGAVERRKEEMQQQHLDTEEEMRQQMLDVEQRRMTAEQNRASAVQSGQDLRDKQAMLQTMIQLNAGGQVGQDALDDMNDYLANDEHFGKTGIQLQKPPQKPDPNVGQSVMAQALKQSEQFLAEANAPGISPEDAARKKKNAQLLQDWASNYGKPQATGLAANDQAAAQLETQRDALQSQLDNQPEADPINDPLKQAQISQLNSRIKYLRPDPTQYEEVSTGVDRATGQPTTMIKRKVAAPAAGSGTGFNLYKNPAGQTVKVPKGTAVPANYTLATQ